MKRDKIIITLSTIIAVITIAAAFLGVNHLKDAYVNQQIETQPVAQAAMQSDNQTVSDNQTTGGQQSPAYVQNQIQTVMKSPKESGVCGEDLKWYYKDGVLFITGTGEMDQYIYSESSAPWYDSLGNQISSVIIDEGVTSIGDSAFMFCESLAEITIPSSVTSIGNRAFQCCGGLTEITIPDTVMSIGDWAFSNCINLTKIDLPDSITVIGDGVFNYCFNLTEITIPDSVTGIGDSAFCNCESLTEITIPDSVTSIGDSAFYDCESLTEITLPDSVTWIGMRAFGGCSDMTIYYNGDALDSYIDRNNDFWSAHNIVWVKQ